ncbi:MAG: hypothetical protein WA071_00790 [Undibacterium umbellatum]|uniref:hypothetical protein n=1 Tax=Undibacterium umbellatum TaxID=2762300 RepID=UPI003BB73900
MNSLASKKTRRTETTIPYPDETFDAMQIKRAIEESRNHVRLIATVESIQNLQPRELVSIQNILQHGNNYGYWQTPRMWCSLDRGEKSRNINLRERIIACLPEADRARLQADNLRPKHDIELKSYSPHIENLLNLAVLSLTRYLILLRISDAKVHKNNSTGGALDPSTIRDCAINVLPATWALAVSALLTSTQVPSRDANKHGKNPSNKLLSNLQIDDFNRLSKNRRLRAIIEVKRMTILAERGMWDDVPSIDEASITTAVKGDASPNLIPTKTSPHLPLPDDYVSELGQKSIWIIKELGPNLIDIARKIDLIWREQEPGFATAPTAIMQRRARKVEDLLHSYKWHDSTGAVIKKFPFFLKLSATGRASKHPKIRRNLSEEYDTVTEDISGGEHAIKTRDRFPRNFGELLGLWANLQQAHLFVVGLSMGARGPSETLRLERSCVQYAIDGKPYVSGKTFKLVQRHDGELRDWVIPEIASEAIEQQSRLVVLLEVIGPLAPKLMSHSDAKASTKPAVHLWCQIVGHSSIDRDRPLAHISRALKAYASTLGMSIAPSGQPLRSHRLRKTVARLVALALTQAPKILKDVFGHKSIEMTLHYILADKSLQAEIEKVSRELRIMRAKDTIESIVVSEQSLPPSGGYGGPAALTIKRAIDNHTIRVHKRGEQWDAHSAFELAEILTMQGRSWQQVRIGVICTKFTGTESGPCNMRKGKPEPSRCKSHCQHRLEESFLREDVNGAILASIDGYRNAESEDNSLAMHFWAGQVREHVTRFPDLQSKWSENPIVRKITIESECDGLDI